MPGYGSSFFKTSNSNSTYNAKLVKCHDHIIPLKKLTLEFNRDERNKILLHFYFSKLNGIEQIVFLWISSLI